MGFWSRRKSQPVLPSLPKGDVAVTVPNQVTVYDPNDLLRRLVGNLSQPSRVDELALALYEDPHAPIGDLPVVVQNTRQLLDEADLAGLVTNLGTFNSPEDLLTRANEILPLHPEKAENLRLLLHGRWHDRLLGEQWYITPKGFQLLTGEQ